MSDRLPYLERLRASARGDEDRQTRLATLLEIRRQWVGSTNNATFTRWLDEQTALCANGESRP